MSALIQDVKYAFAMLARFPGFAAIAVLTLALGIGANTALFSVVSGVLLKPLPYSDPDQLVALFGKTEGFDRDPIAYLNFLDWQNESSTFSSMALHRNEDYNLTVKDEAERLSGSMVSAGFFSTLGIGPILGRTFRAEDDRAGAAPVVILGGGFWERKFGSSPEVAGKTLLMNGESYTVVGVVPAGFSFYGRHADVYTPIGQWHEPAFRDRRVVLSSWAFGRLKPGVTLPQARANLDGVARNLAAAYPEADKGLGVTLVPMKEDLVGKVKPFLELLLGAVGFLLLIACANVANLLLARSTSRTREFALRAALGARRGRVIRQLLTESTILAGLGGALGLVLAFFANRVVLSMLPGTLPRFSEVSFDARVLLFTTVISLGVGIAFGLAPALKTSRRSASEVLKEGGRGASGGRHRLQRVFVVVEIAMALVLLAGAGLMVRGLAALWSVDPGFNPTHAITFDLSLPVTHTASAAEARARLRAFDSAVHAIPGVEAVSVTLGSRPMKHDSSTPFWISGQPKPTNDNDMSQASFYLAEPDFLRAMGLTLKRGRFITAQDDEHAPPVVVIDESFARTYFPNSDPVGKRIHVVAFAAESAVVGVVGHVQQQGLDAEPKSGLAAQLYYPFMQLPDEAIRRAAARVGVIVRTTGDPAAVMQSVRSAVRQVDPREVIYGVETMNAVVADSFAPRRFATLLLGLFGALALTLSAIGTYGVIAHLVVQHTHDIGVRVALGAQRSDVLKLVLGGGGRMALLGIAIGLAGALTLTRLMANLIVGVGASDPATFVAVALVLLAVTLLACYVPARRALRVDPVVALRYE